MADISQSVLVSTAIFNYGTPLIATNINVSRTGSFFYILGSAGGISSAVILQYNTSASFDIANPTLMKTFDLDLPDYFIPYGMAFNDDGTLLYVSMYNSNSTPKIKVFRLVSPYDLTGLIIDEYIVDIPDINTLGYGLHFSSDGTKVFTYGQTNTSSGVQQYSLIVPYDVRNMTISGSLSSLATPSSGFQFNNNGTVLLTKSRDGSISQFALTTSFDINTAINTGLSYNVSTTANNFGFEFNTEGDIFYGFTTDGISITSESANVYSYHTPSINTSSERDDPLTTECSDDCISGLWYTSEEAGKTGWILKNNNGRNVDNPVGEYAIDLTYQDQQPTAPILSGAIGQNSFASGIDTLASGIGSFAAGDGVVASGKNATAFGLADRPTGGVILTGSVGDYSFTAGRSNLASGLESTSLGYNNISSGKNSFTVGEGSVSSAISSASIGDSLIAQNPGQVSLGAWNVGTSTDTILEVGIGNILTNRQNGLEVYINGRERGSVKAPYLEPAIINRDVTGKVLITKEYFDAYSGSGGAGGLQVYFNGTNQPDDLDGSNGDVYLWYDKPIVGVYDGNVEAYSGNDILADGNGGDRNTYTEYIKVGGIWHIKTGSDDAPSDGLSYGRRNGVWDLSAIQNDAPSDGAQYVRSNKRWELISSGGDVSTSSGLKRITGSSGDGWRLIGVNSSNYGPIGSSAVDLSQSNGFAGLTGALSKYSLAEGYNTTTSGNSAHAEGYNTTASGYASHAEGYSTIASGYEAHAEGYSTTASGAFSHAGGNHTTASGGASFATGYKTVSQNAYMTAIGKYNEGVDAGTVFEVGNGSATTRSNAFEVYMDGKVIAPSLNDYMIGNASSKVLITREYLENNSSGLLPIDQILQYTGVTSTNYDVNNNKTDTTYVTGNKALFTYSGSDLVSTEYTDTDGLTIILTITYGYTNGNLNSITRA